VVARPVHATPARVVSIGCAQPPRAAELELKLSAHSIDMHIYPLANESEAPGKR
jgi:hypothetical protein